MVFLLSPRGFNKPAVTTLKLINEVRKKILSVPILCLVDVSNFKIFEAKTFWLKNLPTASLATWQTGDLMWEITFSLIFQTW